MGYFVDSSGSYYEGDKSKPSDTAVSQRPSPFHSWSGSLWVLNLSALQNSAYAAIDNAAGVTRAKYITDVAGQAETYIIKAQDAAAYKAASYPSASINSYPMVKAEAIAISGASPTATQYQSAADGILATQASWIAVAASIEQARRAGKISVGAATDYASTISARDAAIVSLAAL